VPLSVEGRQVVVDPGLGRLLGGVAQHVEVALEEPHRPILLDQRPLPRGESPVELAE